MIKNIVFSLIPAKKKSHRLKNKNFFIYKGMPIYLRVVRQSLMSKLITTTYVSSNADLILKNSFKLGAVPIKRPEYLCKKISLADDVILHFIKTLSINIISKNPTLIYLQPTSIKRKTQHIDQAIKLFFSSKAKVLISVKKFNNNVLKGFLKKNIFIEPVFKKFTHSNDQTLPSFYLQNGAIYIFKVKDFLIKKKIPNYKIVPFIMNDDDSFDLNTIQDLKNI
jgi:N-acylneuraminate cytidylyltransferase